MKNTELKGSNVYFVCEYINYAGHSAKIREKKCFIFSLKNYKKELFSYNTKKRGIITISDDLIFFDSINNALKEGFKRENCINDEKIRFALFNTFEEGYLKEDLDIVYATKKGANYINQLASFYLFDTAFACEGCGDTFCPCEEHDKCTCGWAGGLFHVDGITILEEPSSFLRLHYLSNEESIETEVFYNYIELLSGIVYPTESKKIKIKKLKNKLIIEDEEGQNEYSSLYEYSVKGDSYPLYL